MALDTIARVLRSWIEWSRECGTPQGAPRDDGQHIMAVPVWPTVRQFEAWIAALEDARDQLKGIPEFCPDGCRPKPCVCGRYPDDGPDIMKEILAAVRDHRLMQVSEPKWLVLPPSRVNEFATVGRMLWENVNLHRPDQQPKDIERMLGLQIAISIDEFAPIRVR